MEWLTTDPIKVCPSAKGMKNGGGIDSILSSSPPLMLPTSSPFVLGQILGAHFREKNQRKIVEGADISNVAIVYELGAEDKTRNSIY